MSLLPTPLSLLVTFPTSPKLAPNSLRLKPKPRLSPVRCGPPAMNSPASSDNPLHFMSPLPTALISSGVLFLHTFLRILPPDFGDRWRHLLEISRGAESKITQFPYHLIQAVMASEDRRFFYHFGVDPFGLGRAVAYYPNGGGGSTLTQQLVKNVFLTHERKISRKFVEGILSLIVERRLSKWEIMYSYMNKMYWGHGKFGIEAASLFYFGKHPSLLNIGESALLAGILPSPETLNPITNLRRGKYSQSRVLRRMVAAGFLDLETALLIVSQPLCLHGDVPAYSEKAFWGCKKQVRESSSACKDWDWEMSCMLLEAREDMEQWALRRYRRFHQ